MVDGGEGDKNPVIAPQVPAGGLIRQAILDDESHREGNDTMGVVRLGQGVVGHVRVEVLAAARATMLRVDKVDVTRTTGDEIPPRRAKHGCTRRDGNTPGHRKDKGDS
jgi:hypothetical protein